MAGRREFHASLDILILSTRGVVPHISFALFVLLKQGIRPDRAVTRKNCAAGTAYSSTLLGEVGEDRARRDA